MSVHSIEVEYFLLLLLPQKILVYLRQDVGNCGYPFKCIFREIWIKTITFIRPYYWIIPAILKTFSVKSRIQRSESYKYWTNGTTRLSKNIWSMVYYKIHCSENFEWNFIKFAHSQIVYLFIFWSPCMNNVKSYTHNSMPKFSKVS